MGFEVLEKGRFTQRLGLSQILDDLVEKTGNEKTTQQVCGGRGLMRGGSP